MAGDQTLFTNVNRDLNQILSNVEDSEHEIKNVCVSHYLDAADMKTMFSKNKWRIHFTYLNNSKHKCKIW